ncbi:hypothetical protein RUM44_006552 [Polyplax serrata]|uniref:Uncharacterized protein n=1 Tax=Polyplax serrata TaxID=468196 RepID=A0ABR1AIM0_POLSC
MEKVSSEEEETGWNVKKIRKVLGHVGLLLAVSIYTVIGALVSYYHLHSVVIVKDEKTPKE